MIGSFGDAEVFSFHATKFFNTFEGGAVADQRRRAGREGPPDAELRLRGYDKVIYLGTNGKMNEVSAAMGLTAWRASTSSSPPTTATTGSTARIGRCARHPMAAYDERERCNYQYMIMEVDEAAAGLSRDDLVHVLQAENVLARRYFYPGCIGWSRTSYFPCGAAAAERPSEWPTAC